MIELKRVSVFSEESLVQTVDYLALRKEEADGNSAWLYSETFHQMLEFATAFYNRQPSKQPVSYGLLLTLELWPVIFLLLQLPSLAAIFPHLLLQQFPSGVPQVDCGSREHAVFLLSSNNISPFDYIGKYPLHPEVWITRRSVSRSCK